MSRQWINKQNREYCCTHAAPMLHPVSAALVQQLLRLRCNMSRLCCRKGRSKTAKTARIAAGLIYSGPGST
jgi:hypothetical protein